ncbi:MAG: hypothetical protein IT292_01745 [Deltaproteobacteria bacterium]|nr:hypothetical protein [Deltaproteobacteria bacterium]
MDILFRIVGFLIVFSVFLPLPVPTIVPVALFFMLSFLLAPQLMPAACADSEQALLCFWNAGSETVSRLHILVYDITSGILLGLAMILPVLAAKLFYAWFTATVFDKKGWRRFDHLPAVESLKIFFYIVISCIIFELIGFERLLGLFSPLLLLSWPELNQALGVGNTGQYFFEILRLVFLSTTYLAFPWLLISLLFDLAMIVLHRYLITKYEFAPYKMVFAIFCLTMLIGFYIASVRQLFEHNMTQIVQVVK